MLNCQHICTAVFSESEFQSVGGCWLQQKHVGQTSHWSQVDEEAELHCSLISWTQVPGRL